MNSDIIGKGIKVVAGVFTITREMESSRDNDLAEEGKLADIPVLYLHATETICSWEGDVA